MGVFDDLIPGGESPTSTGGAFDDLVPKKKQNKGILGDLGTDLKRSVEQLPGIATGLVDIPVAAITGKPLVGQAADTLGGITGFAPSKWAKDAEAEYSPARVAAKTNVDQAWKDNATPFSDAAGGDFTGLGNVAKSYIQNPQQLVGTVAESIPSMLAGGAISKGLIATKTLGTGAGIMAGEGSIMAGQQMDQLSQTDADPRIAAGSSALTGITGGALGLVGGRVAQKLGVIDPDVALATGAARGVATEPVDQTVKGAIKEGAKRVAGGAVSEGVFEELPQSVIEQGLSNFAQDKPLDEGMGRAAVEGTLAGSLMGGAFNVMPGAKYVESKRQPAEDTPEIAGLLPAPTYTGTPSDQMLQADAERQAAIDAADANAAAVYAARDAFEQQLRQAVTIINEPAPLQQRIDDMLNVDTGKMSKAERTDYEKSLTAAFNEPIGIRHDANQREVPFTMGEYLDAQLAAENAARARPLKQNAGQQSNARIQQVADEETGGYVAPEIPVVGTLSAVANMAVKSGAHQTSVMQQAAAQAVQSSEKDNAGTTTGKQGAGREDLPDGNRDVGRNSNYPVAARVGQTRGAEAVTGDAVRTQEVANATQPSQMAAQAPQANAPQAGPADVAAQAASQGQGGGTGQVIDLTDRNPMQLNYLARNGKPGYKEAAIAEIEKRGGKIAAPQASVNSETVPALNATDSANGQQAEAGLPASTASVSRPAPAAEDAIGWTRMTTVEREGLLIRAGYGGSGGRRLNLGGVGALNRAWEKMGQGIRDKLTAAHEARFNQEPIKNDSPAAATVSEEQKAPEQEPIKNQSSDSTDMVPAVDAVSQPKTDTAPEAKQDKAPASKPKPARNKIDPEKDSLFVAIAKSGGMDTDELLSNGFYSNDITYETSARVSKKTGQLGKKRRMPISFGFALPLHKKGGMSFDGMREAMQQYGYLPQDATKNDAIDLFRQELSGDPIYTAQAIELRRDQDQEQFDKQMQEEQDRIDNELAAQEIAESESGFDDLSDLEQDVANDFAELAFGENEKQDENAIRNGMRALGFTEEEINDELAKNSQAQREIEEIAAGPGQESGAGRDGNGAQDAQARQRDGEEGFDLVGQTNGQAAEQFASQQTGENDAPTKAQADQERDAVPFSLGMQSQPKPQGVQTGLFTADGRAAKDATVDAEKPAESKPVSERDSFELNRLNRETDQMEKVTFERGEYVRYALSGKDVFGDIDGISHARQEFSVDGLWHPFGFAYKAERPAKSERTDTVPLSSVIEKANAKFGEGLTDADRVPLQYNTMAEVDSAITGIYEGTVSLEDYKAAFNGLMSSKDAITAELGKMTIPQLLERFGKQPYGRPEKKGEIVERAFEAVRNVFALRRSYGRNSYTMGGGMYEKYLADNLKALTELVNSSTADDLKKFSDEIGNSRAARQEKIAAAQDPKTIEDFDNALRLKKAEGMTFAEARMSLTPEQRAEYDRLKGIESRDQRKARADQQKTDIRVASQTTDGQVVETKHTKTGEPLFVVKAGERVDRDIYNLWNATAKRMGGHYSSFRGNGAVPGFQFKTRDNADAFLSFIGGNAEAAKEVVQERRDSFADDRSQSAVERLNEMAERLEERADESLGRERKANTERRARFAASAESAANSEKAMAKTMRRIASAISDGTTKFLDRVRQKAQVEYLAATLRTAKGIELRTKYPSYVEQQRHEGEPATGETADYAEFPQYAMMRSDLANLARKMVALPNMKMLGQRILKVADDTSDAYTAFAKEHLLEVSRFGKADGGGWATFSTLKDAERSIDVSNLVAVAVPLQIKRGEYRIVLSPSEAINRGIWKGDDRKMFLSPDVGEEIVEKLGRLNRKYGKRRSMDAPPEAPWQFENAYNNRKRLAGLGIEQPWEFRAALREFAELKEAPKEADKIKAMERAMVGRKNDGLDFFPTPAETAQAMIDAAEITEGMSVLEPSAGMGHIAEQIRDVAGIDPDVIEFNSDRRELLEAKGFNVVGNDFMEVSPRGFTYGDVFRAPDGTVGVMRGGGGLGSNRVGLQPLDESGKPDARRSRWVDRDSLEEVEKRGLESGYDRIIMNPPFSNRRDAEHVKHAYSLLRPGGRMVAIMGEGVFFGQDNKAVSFREWLDEVGGTSEKLEEGTFLDPSLPVNTATNARMVVIDKLAGEVAPADNDGVGNIASQGSITAADKAIYGMASEGKSAAEILKFIASASRNPFNRQLAKLLQKTGITPSVQTGSSANWKFNAGNDKKYAAAYNPKTNTVSLFRPASAERHMLHELMHAATLQALSKKGLAASQMKALFAHVKKSGALNGQYGMSDVDEFIAEAFTNPKFQDALKKVSVPLAASGIKSAWHWFVRIVKNILGLPQGQESALSQAIEIGLGVMREDMKLRNAIGHPTDSRQAIAAAEITGKEIERSLGRNIQEKATNWMRGNLQGKSFTNDSTGWEISIGRKGINKTMNHGAKDLHARSVAALPGMLKNAVLVSSQPVRHVSDRMDVFAVHHFYAPFSVNGDIHLARMVVKETRSGQKFYDYDTSDVISPAKPVADALLPKEGAATGNDAGPTMSMATLLSHVKKEHGGSDPKFIRYNVADEGWSVAEPSKMDDVIYAMQDKQIDLKRVVQSIMQTGKKIKDDFNAYLQEELFHGRAAKGVKDFLDFELRPLLADMQKAGVDMGDFEEYLWNRHAPERNAQIAKINPDMPDGGSGIKTADARAYMAGLSAEQKSKYEALAKRIETINANSQGILVISGLEKQSTIDAWNGAYKNYVPLQREDVDSGHVGTGKGFSVRGSSSKRAMGSGKAVVDIIANLTMQRERNIVRAEKNRVSNALLGLAMQNPNPDFWTVDQAPKERVVEEKAIYTVVDQDGNRIDEFTRMDEAERLANKTPGASIDQTWGDRIAERVTPGFKNRDNVLLTRVNGDDHYVIFNERDERAMRTAMAMKNLDVDNMGRVLSVVGKATRYLASINTQYNPVFGVINLIRDAQGALINLSSTVLAGEQKRVLGYTVDALRGIYADIRAHRSGEKPSSNWAKLFEEFQKEGGQTGYRDQFANAEARAEAIKSELEQFKEGKAKQLTRGLFGWLSDYNETMENAVRLAAYKAAKEKGVSNQQAASLAKNITVNFNRKGQMATQVGALYAFFNASVQGSARLAETLFEMKDGDIKTARLSKTGKKIVVGGIMLGSMQAMLLAAAGYDDDEPPEFIRERNLILPIGDGKYLTLAMPLGFHVIPGIGRIATEFVMSGGKDPIKKMASFVSMFAESFNPVGSSGFSLQTITPSVVDPFAALAENRDFTGKEIYREDFNKLNPTPGNARAKDVATVWSRYISEALNFMTGGTEFKPGLFSPSPDSIDYLIGQVTGGSGREASKLFQTGSAVSTGEDLPLYKIPLIGRFVGDTEGQGGQSAKFYEAIKQINMHEAEYKGLLKDGRRQEASEYLADNPAVKLIMAGNHAELTLRKLRSQKRDLVEKDADKEQVRAVDERITATMLQFNERAGAVI